MFFGGGFMRPPCELVIKCVLPVVRSLVAKELIERHGFSQVAAAKKLGVTQAAISHYLYSKRGMKYLERVSSIGDVSRLVKELADGIASGAMSDAELVTRLCGVCSSMRSQRLLCDIHKGFGNLPDTCNLCTDI